MEVLERYTDEAGPSTQVRWLKGDRRTPWDFTEEGWNFKVDILDGNTIVKTKNAGLTGGSGGTSRDITLANLVIEWQNADFSGLGTAQGKIYGLRIGASKNLTDWMFFGDTTTAPRILIKSIQA